jgi:hypothetical protein
MFTFNSNHELPTERDQAIAEEIRLFDTIRRAWLFPRVGAVFDEHATDKLMHVWKTLIDGISESTRRVTGARMSMPTLHINELLKQGANPQAIDVLQLIQHLPVVGVSVQEGPTAALELITVLVGAGYRVTGEEVDAITRAFGHTLNVGLTGSAWLNAGCPAVVLHTGNGVRA